jgi:flagellar FliL protein
MTKMRSAISLLVVIIVLLILIIIGGVGTYFYMQEDTNKVALTPKDTTVIMPTINKLEEGEDVEKISQIGPLYPLDPFTVNLVSEKGSIYLKIKLDLELSVKELQNELDAKNAVIRDVVIRILTSQTYEDISSDSGKEAMLDEIANKINAMLEDGYIKNVYITEFVVQ